MKRSRHANIRGSEEIEISRIPAAPDINLVFPNGLSFFDAYLEYWTKEILEMGGEAYVSRTSTEDTISGIFLYEGYEKTGTICTRSREVFDYFYKSKPFGSIFAEIPTEHENEIYDIYTIDLANSPIVHGFSHEISIMDEDQVDEIERFMVSTHPGINKKWVGVASKNGENCFMVRLGSEIAGVAWLSLVNEIGRMHSLAVKPRFRRMGIGLDLLCARLLWLKSKHARSAFSEISRDNLPSSKIAIKSGMRVSGQVYRYFKRRVAENTARLAVSANTIH
ncbi:GNAT family N-acetyltransferase [Candidatus Bathyarchaeota archaeon]|nr:MAG: GNAT family N-acetyltransferase [Candidatus Bathyarchaeota archaeon]